MNGKKFLLKGIALLLLIVLSASSPEEQVINIETLLNEMINRDVLPQYPKKDFRLRQESSYNRASTIPSDSAGWYTNHDFNSKEVDHNFIRVEEINGEKEWVLMDHSGPGVIVRTWMPFRKPNISLSTSIIKFYLDGSEEPALEGNTLDLLNGSGLFPFPLAHKSLRSAVSFFPIPYAKSCKITVSERPFFYQFTYREYEEGTNIKTFTTEDFDQSKNQIQDVCQTLLDAKVEAKGKVIKLDKKIGPNEERAIELPAGPSAVRGLSVKLDSYLDSTITRTVILKMEFDGHPTVWCPIGDFFGSGIGLNPFQGWYRTITEDGLMSSRWIMPYQQSAKLSILNLGEEEIEVQVETKFGEWDWDENSMYFNAAFRGEKGIPTRPFSDWNYVTIKGRGVFVGDALTIMNPVEKWWGEGDEKIWVDGEDFPSIFGTGTEDYYGYSWGGRSTDFYEHPFHAQPRSHIYNKLNRKTTEERNTMGYSTETRSRSLDVMPFASSLQLDMEIWSWTECEMDYAVGVYWYGFASTSSNRSSDPESVKTSY